MPLPVSLTVTVAESSCEPISTRTLAWSVHGLNGIKEKIQKHLVNLIAVVLDVR